MEISDLQTTVLDKRHLDLILSSTLASHCHLVGLWADLRPASDMLTSLLLLDQDLLPRGFCCCSIVVHNVVVYDLISGSRLQGTPSYPAHIKPVVEFAGY